MLLARLTVVPPLGAGALNVTVQASVPAAVIDEFAQLSPINEAVAEAAAAPLPCNCTVPPIFTFELEVPSTFS